MDYSTDPKSMYLTINSKPRICSPKHFEIGIWPVIQLSLGSHAARIWKPFMKGIQGEENVCNIIMLFVT